jgi:hypothetical protein
VKKLNQKYSEILDHKAIGLANLDYDQFVEEDNFQGGEVFVDEKKASYNSLNFKRKNVFSLLNPRIYFGLIMLLWKGITGNIKGDGFQLGGTIICDYKGEIIYRHVQETYDDFPEEKVISDAVLKYYLDHENTE